MNQPLSGFRIADFSHVMAGPYASHLLQMMGAEVIKIEPKGGDRFRDYGADQRYEGMSPAFIAANAGKKSIALDLKVPNDLAIARDIISRSDVVLENFRPGVMARLGLGYEAVRALRPDIVYCSVSGYGQEGPYRDWPAIDNIVQATSGMMMLSGEEGDPPVRVGFPIVDTLSGQTAAIAILGALMQREREGVGSNLDVSMFDASLAFMTSALTPFLVTGAPMNRMGNTGYSGLPTASLFTAGDGRQISLGVVQQSQFEALARIMGRDDWLADPQLATIGARRSHFQLMYDELSKEFLKDTASSWETRLSDAGVPCGMVRRVDQAVDLARETALVDLILDGFPQKRMQIPGAGYRVVGQPPIALHPPPQLDADRDAILAWLASE